MELSQKYPVRKSPRATWHDYNGGEYFVTICTKNMEHYFGEISAGEMHYSALGEYAKECVAKMESLHADIFVPLFVVMPNHIHAIIIVDGNAMDIADAPSTDDVIHRPYKKEQCKNGNEKGNENLQNEILRQKYDEIDEKMQKISQRRGYLSVVIGGMKRALTKFARKNAIDFAWHGRYHDHIVRNQEDMNRIADYIETNVACWADDKYYLADS